MWEEEEQVDPELVAAPDRSRELLDRILRPESARAREIEIAAQAEGHARRAYEEMRAARRLMRRLSGRADQDHLVAMLTEQSVEIAILLSLLARRLGRIQRSWRRG